MELESYFGAERAVPQEDVFESEIRRARELLRGVERPATLDIGSGGGRVMDALKRAGFEVWGLEPSTTFREAALQSYGFDPLRLQHASIEDGSFPDNSFDFITFGAVLEHLPTPGAAIEKAIGWLRPGGLIHVEVPSSRWLVGRLLNRYFRLIGSGLVTNLSPMHPPYHLFEFSVESFRRHGERSGYCIAAVTHFPGTPFVGGGAARLLRYLMRVSGTGMQLTVWLRAT
jgi:SAM-dependent methyltransferase